MSRRSSGTAEAAGTRAPVRDQSRITGGRTIVDSVLRAHRLRKSYGRGTTLVRAVDEIDLEVAAGEAVAIIGPSGCGKSTLLHLLGCLDRPDGGELWLAGRRVDGLSETALARLRSGSVGFVFQDFHLMEELTAQENVELPALVAGVRHRTATRRASELLDRVCLGVAMVVAALSLRRDITARDARTVGPMFVPGAGNPVTERAGEIILVLAVALFTLAAINTVITAWTTSLDTMRPVAVIGALGATPRQITSGLSAAQLLPALGAAVAGIPLGLLVHASAWAAGGGAGQAGAPSPWLVAVLPGTLLVVLVLTAAPIRRICHRPIPELLATAP